MNPCPCGQAGADDRPCVCPPGVPERYANRVSGPLRDRIDLWIVMPQVAPAALLRAAEPETSIVVARRIVEARARQSARSGSRRNGRLTGRTLRDACRLRATDERRAVQLAELERMSGRGTERLLRVARTIADLAGDGAVRADHLDEAARFRPPNSRAATALAV